LKISSFSPSKFDIVGSRPTDRPCGFDLGFEQNFANQAYVG